MACCSWFFHEFCLAVFVATLWRSVAMWYMMWHRKWTDASLTSAVDWLLTQCGRSQTECRHACMQLVTSLSHCLPGQSVSLRRSMPVCLTASQVSLSHCGALCRSVSLPPRVLIGLKQCQQSYMYVAIYICQLFLPFTIGVTILVTLCKIATLFERFVD